MHGRKAAFLMFFVLLSPLVTWPRTALSQDNNDDPLNIYPTDRVEAEIDDSQRFSLNGNVHPLARPENLVGEVSPSQPMERMVLVLGPDVSQPEALEELIRAQQDPASRYYHQWITPEAFGEHYGISESDLAQVADWLEMHGMKVDEVPSSRRAIVFSGTAGQVESTFHTSMQKYSVRGEAHYANASDPEIPQALAEVVQGVVSLHDFRSAALHEILPAFTVSSSVHYLAPLDWDAIYDVEPLASQGLDGSGQSIAVVGRSDITMSDVATFRSNFGLPAKNPTIITNGPDPGIPDSGDEIESTLDVEWAGAIAKNVSVKFVTSRSTATDGIALSSAYVVSKNVAPIITVSYGVCEAALGVPATLSGTASGRKPRRKANRFLSPPATPAQRVATTRIQPPQLMEGASMACARRPTARAWEARNSMIRPIRECTGGQRMAGVGCPPSATSRNSPGTKAPRPAASGRPGAERAPCAPSPVGRLPLESLETRPGTFPMWR